MAGDKEKELSKEIIIILFLSISVQLNVN